MVRKDVLNVLRNQKEEDRLRKSRVILEKLLALPEFQIAKTILFYAAFDGEVDTFEMMARARKAEKTIALPITQIKEQRIVPCCVHNLEEDLEHGPYDILQPRAGLEAALSVSELDLVIVPGVAFDRRNRRLGRGAGFYDRFLSVLPEKIPTIGIAFDFQVLDSLPAQAHDMSVTRVITN